MKNLILLSLFIFSSIMTTAQTQHGLLTKNYEARGGEVVLRNLHSIEADISMENDKGVIDGKMYVVDQTAYRLEMQIMGHTNYFLVTPVIGEMYFPVQGQKAPELMTEDQYLTMRHYLDITGPLFNSINKNIHVEVGGPDRVGEEEVTVFLVMEEGSLEPTRFYISNETNQLIKTSRITQTEEGIVDFVTTFSNFKEDKKSGYVYPATIKNNMGTITIKKIRVNEEVPNDLITLSKKNDKNPAVEEVEHEAMERERLEQEQQSQNK